MKSKLTETQLANLGRKVEIFSHEGEIYVNPRRVIDGDRGFKNLWYLLVGEDWKLLKESEVPKEVLEKGNPELETSPINHVIS